MGSSGISNSDSPPAEIRVREAVSADAPEIVRIIRSGFPESLLPLVLYDCHGMPRDVADRIGERGEYRYWVAERAGKLAGAASFRYFEDRLFLNQIAVDSAHRAMGVGGDLLRWGGAAAEHRYSAFSLDVFEQNSVAMAWYKKLGFEIEYARHWFDIELPVSSEPAAKILNWPQSEQMHLRYGFSSLDVESSRGRYSVGKLGDHWFRVTQPSLLEDPEALACLSQLDPARRLLLLSDGHSSPAGGTRVAQSFRMTVAKDTLMSSLRK